MKVDDSICIIPTAIRAQGHSQGHSEGYVTLASMCRFCKHKLATQIP